MLNIRLHWFEIEDEQDIRWSYTRCLYAYIAPRTSEILYIGKCDGCSVSARWRGKQDFWRDLERKRKIFEHTIIVADIEVPSDYRLTRELLADAESLLIYRLKPWGNIQCRISRITRAGLRLSSFGYWPSKRRVFSE